MARQKAVTETPIPGPEPMPKAGDLVEYIWPENTEFAGKAQKAKVTAVYDGFDGRLLDLEVDTGKGPAVVKSAPWRDADDEAGNTWHWPLE